MKNVIQKSALLLAMLLGVVSSAFAALPAVVGTTLTAIQDDGSDLIDLVWPVVGGITGAFILFKLFKRGASKI